MDLLSQEGSCGPYSPRETMCSKSESAGYYPTEACSSQAQWHISTVKAEFTEVEPNRSPPLTAHVGIQQQQQPILERRCAQSQSQILMGAVKSEPVDICAQRNSPPRLGIQSHIVTKGSQRQQKMEPGPSTSQQYFVTQTNEPLSGGYTGQQIDLRVHTSIQSPQQQYDARQPIYEQISPTYAFQRQLQLNQPNTPCYLPPTNTSRGGPAYTERGGGCVCGQKADPKAHLVYLRSQQPRQQPQVRPQKSDLISDISDYPPEAPVPDAWCHAYYYELNQRVGEPFKGGRSHVIVDGFCAPSEAERFCLGALANVNRNPGVINARRQIGRGVRIFRREEDVYAECLSEAPIFVQSPIHALQSHDHPATVYRLPPGHTMQIFDNKSFEALLEQTASQGFHAVYSLQRMCHMRISFVKGWGEQYKRQTITSTPCWVEIHLPIPLQKLDRLLSTIAGPTEPVHSFT
ncbi:Mothers against decapentaplegic -like protein 2 [Toxocara canis]|uniref:Mothers against decapentaplegic-like protein 2 n=1 Tax=Toxocara canis TaxID=6265 RepID=A0A0B2UW40_TOXCA|nr:Mothers against decapentaplegic -like protein 2 [Toxocara canis]